MALQRHKKCIVCGAEFTTPYISQICCNAKCRIKRNLESKRLVRLKLRKPKRRKPLDKFSTLIKRRTNIANKLKKFEAKLLINPPAGFCKVCWKKFKQHRSNQVFCSSKCSKEYSNYRAMRDGYTGKKRIKTEHECIICRKKFLSASLKVKTCSKKCSGELKKVNWLKSRSNVRVRDMLQNKTKVRKIIYRGYKDPLIPLPKPYFGYEGVVLEDADSGEIQCHICGMWMYHLGAHVAQHHKNDIPNAKGKRISIAYRDMFGLMHKTALCSEDIRSKLLATRKREDPVMKALRMKRVLKMRGRRQFNNNACAEKKNESGLCFKQLIDLIKKAAIRQGRTPPLTTVRGSDGQDISRTITRTFGDYSTAVKLAKLKPTAKGQKPAPLTSEFLLEELSNFEENNGREASVSDTRNFLLPGENEYNREFGSFNNALKLAKNV